MENTNSSGVVGRPLGDSPPSWVCNRCDFVLFDGVHYQVCPRCGCRVDWVDLRLPVWACPNCFRMINAQVSAAPACGACQTGMRRLAVHEAPRLTSPPGRWSRLSLGPSGLLVEALALSVPVLSLALNPQWRWFALGLFAPAILLPAAMGLVLMGSAASSIRELLDLARDPRSGSSMESSTPPFTCSRPLATDCKALRPRTGASSSSSPRT